MNNKAEGWLCLWRELLTKPIWVCGTLEQRVLLITLLCMANHSPQKWEFGGEIYEVQAGQFITSIKSIVENCKCKEITSQKVRTALERFEKLGFLTSKSTNKNRLITIVNWRRYQDKTFADNNQNNKQITSRQQTDNKQITTNNNNNNINNDNNVNKYLLSGKPIAKKNKGAIPPKVEDVKAYCLERHNGIDPQKFIDYYTANGWKVGKNPMRDWKAALRNWERNDGSFKPQKNSRNYEQRQYTDEELERAFDRKAD